MFRSTKWFHNDSRAPRKPARRPSLQVETLEDRQLLSGAAFSNLGNVPVQFNLLDNGHLLMTQNGAQTDIASGVQGLYQGKDVVGHEVAYELVSNTLKEFTPDQGWIALGAADLVAQDSSETVFFIHGSTLYLATGVPGADVALLGNIQSLSTSGGQAMVQVGSYVKATLGAQLDLNGTGVTLTFSSVQFNLGQLIRSTQAGLNTKIQPLVDTASQLISPISGLPGWTHDIGLDKLTPVDVLSVTGNRDVADKVRSFARTLTNLQNLSGSLTNNGWVTLTNGSLTAHVAADGSLSSVSGNLNAITDLLKQVGVDLSSLQNVGVSLPALEQPVQLVKLLMGQNVNLITYTLPELPFTPPSLDVPLANFPTPIPGSDVQISLHTDFYLSAGATVVLDSSGLQSGNPASGVSLQNQHLNAGFKVGLSGTFWEAFVLGYRVTGTFGFETRDFGSPVPTRAVSQGLVSPFADPQTFSQFKRSIASRLSEINNDVSAVGRLFADVAAGLSSRWHTDIGTIANVLYQDLGASYGNVANALYQGVTQNFGDIADAIYHGIQESGYGDVANGLWSLTHDFGRIAAALRNRISSHLPLL